ncbi:DUF4192 domain-containing protein [Jatrophihabitans endophyticus]|nr:DUF4192 domain-containing protein [Jatrophihabitans endophyticus]
MTRRSSDSSGHASGPSRVMQRIAGPGELAQAVPYLLGFHPRRSLVLVGLRTGELVVTARLDLDDVAAGGDAGRGATLVAQTIGSMADGGAVELVAVVFDDDAPVVFDDDARVVMPGAARGRSPLPWTVLVERTEQTVAELPCVLLDALLVARGRWWTYACAGSDCCPPAGRPLPSAPSAFAAAATVDGVVPLPGRESLAALLAPLPDPDREALHPALAAAENDLVAATLDAHAERHVRSVKRALFAAARAGDRTSAPPPAATVARFAVALLEPGVRDAVWLAVDDRRLDGRGLWRDLARRLPSPYDAAPLFLFGWASWRAGNGALAGMAAERALAADPAYGAADLLLAAVSRGVDPRRFPRLRRSA